MATAENTPSIALDACVKMVEASARACPAPTAPASSAEPSWDALANSFAGLSAAFTWGSILLAVVAVIAAAGWGFLVKVWAEREARDEASKCATDTAQKLLDKWLAEQAPQLIRENVELLQNASIGDTNDQEAADEIGKEAG